MANKTKMLPILAMSLMLCSCASTDLPPPPLLCESMQSGVGVGVGLRGLSAIDADGAWVAGGAGTFLRTLDAGRTWTSGVVPGAETLEFRDVEAFDRDSALLMSAGRPARFFKTDDGGAAWREVYRNDEEGVFFDSMAFWDRRRGLAFSDPVGESFLVVATDDGGETWRTVPSENLPKPLPGEAGFAASGTSLTVAGEADAWFATGGPAARVFRSADGGMTWTAATTPMRNGEPSQGIFSIAFRDSLHGVVVGGDYLEPDQSMANVALTDDGGATWRPVEGSPPGGYRSAVAWLESGAVWIATGPSGTDYSADAGLTWRPLTKQGFHALAPADGVVWAAGANGAVGRCH